MEAKKQIVDLDFQIIDISLNIPENLKITKEKDKVKYTMLSDSERINKAKAAGFAFETPENYKSVIIVHSNEANRAFLPVSSVLL